MEKYKVLQVSEKIQIEVYGEICCDDCNEIIHNHIDCPICKKKYASTNQFQDLKNETEISCDNCGTVFKKKSEYWYYDCEVEIIKSTTTRS